jgi:hypothetical protein
MKNTQSGEAHKDSKERVDSDAVANQAVAPERWMDPAQWDKIRQEAVESIMAAQRALRDRANGRP